MGMQLVSNSDVSDLEKGENMISDSLKIEESLRITVKC